MSKMYSRKNAVCPECLVSCHVCDYTFWASYTIEEVLTRLLLVIVGRWVVVSLPLMHLAMSPEVGDNREVTSTALNFACECYIDH